MGQGLAPGADCRRLLIDFPDDKTMRISHEAIHQAFFVQGLRSAAPLADGLLANRTCVTGPQGART
ncbi:hypothetical protein MEA186_10891 [Mesorhizobium amorphae CCNWGS0123]|uniref:Uncharacterized protein n=1 Tax=Mesorhizobium amorphae CCNWGS0123 TaxID=1082933 RepID=G6Y8B1_9HYPH|nr:hypothetical protein A6B35_32430 [Mesorhizobium amorphae CCNWGS0123]EHH12011.1 hypothetical protein MEA186_10891 [Mesorhizobium amorphae CCNWGS0123]